MKEVMRLSEVSPLNGLVGHLPTTLNAEDAKAPGEMGKNDFLKLMIAQLQYQDPMNPMDASQFSAQLAQFTVVEELQNLNTTTERGVQTDILLAQSINNAMSSSLIGKEVKAITTSVLLKDGESGKIGFDLPYDASQLQLVIRDSNGGTVRTMTKDNLASGEGYFKWDGKDDFGNKVSDGNYSV